MNKPHGESAATPLRSAFAFLLGSTFASQIVGLVSIPLIAWLYAPSAFGVFTSIWVVASTIGIVATLRYERAIVLVSTEKAAIGISTIAYLSLLLVSTMVLLVAFAFYKFSSLELPYSHLFSGMVLMSLFSIYQTQSQWLVRKYRFKYLAVGDFIGVSATVVAQCSFGFTELDEANGLLFGAVAGRIVQYVYLQAGLFDVEQISLRIPRRRLQALAFQYRSFPVYSVPYSIVSVSQSRALIVVAATYASAEAVGLLALAHRVTYLPVTMIANALRRVYVSRMRQELGENRFTYDTSRIFEGLSILLIPFSISIGFVLPLVVERVLPAGWYGVVFYAIMLLPGAAALLLSSWFDRIFEVVSRQNIALVCEVGSSVIIISVYWLYLRYGGTLENAVLIFGILVAVYNLLWLLVCWKLSGFNLIKMMANIVPGCIATGLVAISLSPGMRFSTLALSGLVCMLTISFIYLGLRAYRRRPFEE